MPRGRSQKTRTLALRRDDVRVRGSARLQSRWEMQSRAYSCMHAGTVPSRNRVQSPNITQAKGSGGWVLSLGSGAWVRHSSRTTGLRQWSGVIGQPDRWLDRKKPPGGLSSCLPGGCLRPWGWSGPCRHAHRRHPPCLASPSWASAIPRPSSLRVLERRLMRKVIPKGEKARRSYGYLRRERTRG